jgi:hypothetical protein
MVAGLPFVGLAELAAPSPQHPKTERLIAQIANNLFALIRCFLVGNGIGHYRHR